MYTIWKDISTETSTDPVTGTYVPYEDFNEEYDVFDFDNEYSSILITSTSADSALTQQTLRIRVSVSSVTDISVSGNTVVGGTTWTNLKATAMEADFTSTFDYTSLNDGDKRLVNALIGAQTDQGDMFYLQPTLINTALNKLHIYFTVTFEYTHICQTAVF